VTCPVYEPEQAGGFFWIAKNEVAIFDLNPGSKVIYKYPDMKITFKDGKVADVE
jgi:hypothetical protein